jgi:hypothetical protein
MLTFKLNESTNFEFNMQIQGDADAKPEVMFVINEGEKKICLDATPGSNGQYSVKVPDLKGVLKTGTYVSEIWVTIGDKLFKPLIESIEIKEDVKPVISAPIKESTIAPTVTIKNTTITKIEATPTIEEEIPVSIKPKKNTEADDLLMKSLLSKKK